MGHVSHEGCRDGELKVTSPRSTGIEGLGGIADVRALHLNDCIAVKDVRSLATAPMLEELDLVGSGVTQAGITGLERIATLRVLKLSGCTSVTNVAWSALA